MLKVADRIPLPPRVCGAYYREYQPDLKLASDAAAIEHFHRFGCEDGRIGSPFATREGLIAFARTARSALEIGPFCRPLLTGNTVEYLDVLDADALRARAVRLGLDPAGCPPHIHHVAGLEQVDRVFEIVVSSHAIEHQPDLIRHLEEVARVLEPDGRFVLIVPDKRFCFDHFLPVTSIAEVLEAYHTTRTIHPLSSVVEHMALVTHNDAARHWRGDHGELSPSNRAERVRQAVRRYEASDGEYLDVHSWQFTPASFRDVLELLDELGLSAFEVEEVYDTPRDRQEFCAVLRRRRIPQRSPRRNHGMDITIIQTADAFRYAPMLAATAPTAVEFARRHGLRYESFVGLKRGYWNWQATYNRIVLLKEKLDAGFTGWAIYLDADAYIYDLEFDLPAYLAARADYGVIFATSGVTGEHWDVNAGVAFVNLGHEHGRQLVELWWAAFHEVSDQRLRSAREWLDRDNDQDLLHQILRRETTIATAMLVEDMDFLNSRHARFIRQHLRAQTGEFDARLRAITAEVHNVLRRSSATLPGLIADIAGDRERAQVIHAIERVPELVVAPDALPSLPVAYRVITAWHAADGKDERVPPFQQDFVKMLNARDADAVAGELAHLGRAALAQGFFGGSRQHKRCAEDAAFAQRRAIRTFDALLSLAEAVGALDVENPDVGSWGQSSRLSATLVWERIRSMMGTDLTPPQHIGGHLGIAVGASQVLHLRTIEAVYTAWRVKHWVELLRATRVVEIGGGSGMVAYYARCFDIPDYTIFDTPVMNAIQGYVLGQPESASVALAAADHSSTSLKVASLVAFPASPVGTIDLLVNEDTLHDMDPTKVIEMLREAQRLKIGALLSLNHEANAGRATGEKRSVRALVAEAGGYRLAQRARHSLRPGFVEEVFLLK